MRRIKTQEEKDRVSKRNAWIIGLVMIFLMLASTAGYAFFSGGNVGNSQNSNEDYNGNYFVYQKNGQNFYFTFPLAQVVDIPVEISSSLSDYYGQKVYLASNTERSWNELSINFASITSNLQEACYGPCERDLPEKDCNSEKMIVWQDSDSNLVRQEGQCVIIEGDLSALDAFLYNLLDIA